MAEVGIIDATFWRDKRVLVTGHTGFKGSWLTLWLLELGAEVYGYALEPPTQPNLFDTLRLNARMHDERADVRNRSAMKGSLAEFAPDVIFHLAAQPIVLESYRYPAETYETNVMGTVNLLDAVRTTPSVQAVVIVTTDKCYENREWIWGYREDEAMGGFDPYSSSKGCAELVVSAFRRSFFAPQKPGAEHHVALASARAGNVIGGGDWAKDRLIPDLLRAIGEGIQVKIRNPHAVRPWQHVLEPLSGYLQLAQRLFAGGSEFASAWNFGPNDEDARPVEWIVRRVCELVPGSKGYIIDGALQPHEAGCLKLDCSKARQILRWSPRWTLETALDKVVEWALAYARNEDMRNVSLQQIDAYKNRMAEASQADE